MQELKSPSGGLEYCPMSDKKNPTKFIFISGGVLSGLGKGVTASSLGFLLQNRGYKITNIKCENYLNLDSGNINPTEHGDVFLCEDGTEADMDLGTYERFLGQEVGAKNYTTIGQIYQKVINDACNLKYGGATVEAIPHVPEEVIRRIEKAAEGYEIVLIELGGTAGEYQNIVYFEAYRIMKLKRPNDVIHAHVTYFPRPEHINELKSKPTQLSVKQLQSMGIQPDFIIGRSPIPIDEKRKEKVAYFCNVTREDVISNQDMKSIYQIPLNFAEQDFDKRVLEKLQLPIGRANLSDWRQMVDSLLCPDGQRVQIGIISKYIKSGDFELQDSYASLLEALKHAAAADDVRLEIKFIDAESLEAKDVKLKKVLGDLDGIVVPIGWGSRGVEGKIAAIKFAREHKVPYLGLCYGMQLAVIEWARNVAKIKGATTEEIEPEAADRVIHAIPFDSKYQKIKGEGASMRLGGYDCILQKGSLVDQIYAKSGAYKDKSKNLISERHRHRYEVNNAYLEKLEGTGLVFSGKSPDGFFVEMIELPKKIHPFFVATQAHPEYKSSPLHPHPLFSAFLEAAKPKPKAKLIDQVLTKKLDKKDL